MDPKVSIIMPIYNAEQHLAAAVSSVLAQTYRNFELICVNDGSTDGSNKILNTFIDKRIKIIDQLNKGQSVAINKGIALSKGDYIKIFDADDIMNPEHLQAQLERADKEEAVLVSCSWGRFYGDDPSKAIFKPESVWKDMDSLSWMKAALSQRYDHMPGWLWLIPKKLLDKAGGYDGRLNLNNDFEFSMRLLSSASEVRFADKAKIYYRSGQNGNLASSASREAYEMALLSTDLGCIYLLEHEDSSDTRKMCANRYQEWAFRMYPNFKDLVLLCEEKIKELGGSERRMEGSRILSLFQAAFGWKKSKRLQLLLLRLGWLQIRALAKKNK